MYGSSYTKREICALAQKLQVEKPQACENTRTGHNDVEAGEMPKPINYRANAAEGDADERKGGLSMDIKTKRILLASSLDVSALPPMHPSWHGQLINIADGGSFFRGRLVYLAVRVGLVMQIKPFPSRIDAVVIAASARSWKGIWTGNAWRSAKTVREDKEPIWNDDHSVYVVLPRNCVVACGSTGRIVCTAYGVGWVRDGKLQNYTDILLEDHEVRIPRAT